MKRAWVAIAVLSACGGGFTSPPATSGVRFAVQLERTPVEVVGAGHALRLDRARVVLAPLALRSSDGGVYPLTAGPVLLDVPLDGGALGLPLVDVPKGTYLGANVGITRLDDAGVAFIEAARQAGFGPLVDQRASCLLDVVYDGVPTTMRCDETRVGQVSAKSPWVIRAGEAFPFTIGLEPARWLVHDGRPLDPADGETPHELSEGVQRGLKPFVDLDGDGLPGPGEM